MSARHGKWGFPFFFLSFLFSVVVFCFLLEMFFVSYVSFTVLLNVVEYLSYVLPCLSVKLRVPPHASEGWDLFLT